MAETKPLEVIATEEFKAWLGALRDLRAQARIVERLIRLERGAIGQSRSLGGGLHELKVDVGPGYRVYYFLRGATIIYLLSAGDKSTQIRDIAKARLMAARLMGE